MCRLLKINRTFKRYHSKKSESDEIISKRLGELAARWNAYIESFNGKFREECLSTHWFKNIYEAREIIEQWRLEYNTFRPHSALGNLTPAEYARILDEKLSLISAGLTSDLVQILG